MYMITNLKLKLRLRPLISDNQRLQNIIQIFTVTGASFQSLGNLSQKFLKYLQHPTVSRLYSSLLDVDDMLVLLTRRRQTPYSSRF
jgi:hypothetical protein